MSVASAVVQEESTGGSFHESARFLAISARNRGEVTGSWYWAMAKHDAYVLGSASMSRFAAFRWMAATEMWDRCPHGAEGVEPGAEKDRIDSDQGLRHPATHRLPAFTGGVVIGQGTRRGEQAHIPWLGRVEDVPELRDQGRTVGLQGIPDHHQFGRRSHE